MKTGGQFSFICIPSHALQLLSEPQKHQYSKALFRIMWYFNSLNREENPGRDFDCEKCNIYKGMVHYVMITSGIGIAKKTDLGD